MKPETRNTVLMILRADGTVSQPMMDAIVVAMDGGTLENVVNRSEARSILGVSLRQLDKMAKSGRLDRVMGCGSRGIGYTRASVTRCALAFSLNKGGYT